MRYFYIQLTANAAADYRGVIFLPPPLGEGDRALGFPEVSLPSFGGSRQAVEGVLPTIVDFISPREISSRSDLFHDSGFHCTSVEGVLLRSCYYFLISVIGT